MSTDNPSNHNSDEIYFKLWDKQQNAIGQCWFVTIFLVTVSFAIFSYSLHSQNLTNPAIAGIIQRIIAVVVYWFAYLLYIRHSHWINFLREQLEKMESEHNLSLPIQTAWQEHSKDLPARFSFRQLLYYFGWFYTSLILILLLWIVI